MTTDVSLKAALLVASGAALGGLARWGVGLALVRAFPLGTTLVNAVGSFALAFLVFGGTVAGWLSPEARALWGVGFLGAFTTMSAFTAETLSLAEAGAWTRAGLHVVANPALSLACAWLGRWAGLAWSA